MKAIFCCGMAAFFLQGCVIHPKPGDSAPPPVGDALLTVEGQLQASAPITLGNLNTKEAAELFNNAVLAAQCKDMKADPLMPIVTGPINVALQGSVSKASAAAVAAGMAAVPTATGTYTYTVTAGQQQQVTFPYTFVPVSGLAIFYLSQNVSSLANLPTGKVKDDAVKTIEDAYNLIKIRQSDIAKNSKDIDWANNPAECQIDKVKGTNIKGETYFKQKTLSLN